MMTRNNCVIIAHPNKTHGRYLGTVVDGNGWMMMMMMMGRRDE